MAPLFEPAFLDKLFFSINQISDAPPPIPCSHHLSSLSTPTAWDTTVITDAIQDSSNCESLIENLISQVRDVKRALQARLEVQYKYNDQLQGMLSSLRLLPPELLSNIFLLCGIERYPTHLDHSVPWSISRVCRKWRYVCLSTPSLWAHLPTIRLDYKPGFYELLRTAMERSFPLAVSLRLYGTNAENIRHFENILPRIHSLDVEVNNLPMINALVQRKESFKQLKSAKISFNLTNPFKEPLTLDFLAQLTSLTLSYDYATSCCSSLYFPTHWPNLTTFHGTSLPDTFLRQILSVAPLLRRVTMHDSFHVESRTANSLPTSIVCHANLKVLYVTCGRYFSFPHALLQHLHLPGLQNLRVVHKTLSPEPFLYFLRETCGSLEGLSLGEPLGRLDNQEKMYTLCPAMKSFTLSNAKPEDLAILTVSPHSTLCPALRRLTLHNFSIVDADDARIFEDFCASRGLAPFNSSNSSGDCFQLDRVTVYMENARIASTFRRYCLRVDDKRHHTLVGSYFQYDMTSLDFSYTFSEETLGDLHRTISTETPYFLILLEDYGIIKEVKNVADGMGDHTEDIRDDARIAYERWTIHVRELRGKPRWKMTKSRVGSRYVLQRE